jgi:hypothetical protein
MNSEDFESQMNPIPTWASLVGNNEEMMEEMMQDVFVKMQLQQAEKLYNHWLEISTCLFGFNAQHFRQKFDIGTRNFIDDLIENMQPMIYQISEKIYSAAFCDMYILQMENATIIRMNASLIKTDLQSLAMFADAEQAQVNMISDMINAFKIDFKNWVATFRKDDYADDWGLF